MFSSSGDGGRIRGLDRSFGVMLYALGFLRATSGAATSIVESEAEEELSEMVDSDEEEDMESRRPNEGESISE